MMAVKYLLRSAVGYKLVDGLLYGADDWVGQFVNEHCGCATVPIGQFTSIGIVDGSDLVGGVTFFGEQDNDIMIAMALNAPIMAQKKRIARIYQYPFVQLNKPRVTAEISMKNERCIKLAFGMGYKQEGLKEGAADDGGDLGVFGLMKENFRLRNIKR